MANGAGSGRIDVHHNFFPPEYFANMGGMTRMPPVRDWTLDRTLEELDRNDVDTAMLSLSPPGIHRRSEAENRALARTVNEHAAALRAERPSKFGHFASVPMPDVEGTLTEIEYAMDTLGADGIQLMTSYGDKWPGFPEFDRGVRRAQPAQGRGFHPPAGTQVLRSADRLGAARAGRVHG